MSGATAAASNGPVPRDAQAIMDLLASMGMPPGTYQPNVVAQLMEFQSRYSREILEDAQEYCIHRERGGNKSYINENDIDLAVQTRMADSFCSPPAKELLFSLAAARNAVPLPLVPTREGVHLPPERVSLMQPNYRVKTAPPATTTQRRDEHKSHA